MDAIFLNVAGELVVLNQTPYEKETVLQEALANYPQLIAGVSTAGGDSGRLLLVRREMGVAESQDGSNTLSVDHLFLDAEGVPVLVETKRSTDRGIRRKIVGQMLEYAANGTKYWPLAKLQQHVADNAAAADSTADDLIRTLRNDQDTDIDEFWRIVQANLSEGRIRMVFVADQLPPELVRIIEFLNEQMRPAEVLGVEVHQYVGGDGKHVAFVPNVIGKTSRAIVAKETAAGGQQWTELSLLDTAAQLLTATEVTIIQALIDDVHADSGRLSFGRGANPGVSGWYVNGTQEAAIWNLNIGNGSTARAYLTLYFAELLKKVPLAIIEQAAEQLEKIPAMTPKIAEARTREWVAHPTVHMTDVAAAPTAIPVLLDAVHHIAAGIVTPESTSTDASTAPGHSPAVPA